MRFPGRTLGNPGACAPHLARARLNSHRPRLSGSSGAPSARIESPRTDTPPTPPGGRTPPLFPAPPATQSPASSTSTRFPAAARSRSSRAPQAPHDTCVRSSSVSRLPHRTHCRDVYAAGTPATVQSPLRTEISSSAFRNIPGAPFFRLRFMPRLPRPRPRILAWSRSSTTMQRPGRTMRDTFFRHSCRFFKRRLPAVPLQPPPRLPAAFRPLPAPRQHPLQFPLPAAILRGRQNRYGTRVIRRGRPAAGVHSDDLP